MKKQTIGSKRQKLLWGLCLIAAWTGVGFLLYKTHGGFTVEELVNYQPENPLLSCLVMLGLFLLKSVDFIMHSGVLYAADGIMFPLPVALLLNLIGEAIMVTPVYFLGRSIGSPMLDELREKHPKLNMFVGECADNELVLSLLMRSTGIALHVGSLYLGAAKVSFGRYMLGSLLGLLPHMIPYTVMGTQASEPGSPAFLIAVAAEVTVCAGSVLVAFLLRKRAKRAAQPG